MVAFELIIIAAGVTGSALCGTAAFRTKGTISELGRQGGMWFHHAEDHEIDELPDDDAVEEPFPFRPLRSRLR